ncbi:tyrosine-type recombinase/integrase [Cytobacillus sp. FSL R5-0569]|uniref:tyrosine-type recombinase/integrase n=1 Tax=Cytobacillus TaxID=2675230 RepID=UPI0027815D3C|nr:tyrosine-type recombinase/integrase [Cytobacillus kochii]MDQ0185290.1 integrase [Cytobacillus kochii]
MKVQEVLLDGNKKRYMLLDEGGLPVAPVTKYLKYLDATEKSSNTLKTYCYALKQYFDYLEEVKKDYKDINIGDLAEFMGWLRSPYSSSKVTPLQQTKAKKTEKTVNLTITVVTNFYDYLYRNQEIQNDMVEKLMKQLFTGGRTRYKDFLYHINKDKPSSKNILKLKEPRKKVQVLSKEEVEQIYKATVNIRDRLLIKLLFETGLRIGEVLSLFIEDFIFDHKNGHRIQLKNRGELPNGAKLKTGERQIHISQELIDLFDDYLYEFIDELEMDTNFVFVKLHGRNIGQAMNYQDVSALFKRLRDKTEINVHPHLFRHTHASMFYRQTKDIKQVQERLGHSQIQTTMNMYLHPSDEEIRENWEKAQHAFQFSKSEQ